MDLGWGLEPRILEGVGSRSRLRLFSTNGAHHVHRIDIDKRALQASHGWTLGLVTQRMPLESVVVRAVVQITF